jgi:hypothetical protein
MCNARHMQTPDLIGTAEVAALLDKDKATITRWAAEGRLGPVVRSGSKRNSSLLFFRSEIERVRSEAAA